jgi:hypothetical protein
LILFIKFFDLFFCLKNVGFNKKIFVCVKSLYKAILGHFKGIASRRLGKINKAKMRLKAG